MANILEYTHLKLNEDLKLTAGEYYPKKEVRLKYNGREVLYVAGVAVAQYGCGCGGAAFWEYIIVPGYVVNWQQKTNESDLPVSEVEPISDSAIRVIIRQLIKEREPIGRIEFW